MRIVKTLPQKSEGSYKEKSIHQSDGLSFISHNKALRIHILL